MLFDITIYKRKSLDATKSYFKTDAYLVTSGIDSNFHSIINYIEIDGVLYNPSKTTILNRDSFEQELREKETGMESDFFIRGFRRDSERFKVSIETMIENVPSKIELPILPTSQSDYIVINNKVLHVLEVVQSKDGIKIKFFDGYSVTNS